MMTQHVINVGVMIFGATAMVTAMGYVVEDWFRRRTERSIVALERRAANLDDAKREVYVYDMEDGVPVNYRAAYPLLRVSLHVDRMTRELSKMGEAFAGVGIFAERAAKALEGGPW